MAACKYLNAGKGKFYLVGEEGSTYVRLVWQRDPSEPGYVYAAVKFGEPNERCQRFFESLSFLMSGSYSIETLKPCWNSTDHPDFLDEFALTVADSIERGECHLTSATYKRIYSIFSGDVADRIAAVHQREMAEKKEVQFRRELEKHGLRIPV